MKLFFTAYLWIENVQLGWLLKVSLRLAKCLNDYRFPTASRTNNHCRMSRHHYFVQLDDFVELKFSMITLVIFAIVVAIFLDKWGISF